MTTVTVVLLTYSPSEKSPRTEYARITLENLLKNLTFQGDLDFHIADDGSWDGHVKALAKMVFDYGYECSISNSTRRGYGANFNLATQVVHLRADYVMPIEDDWQLMRRLDLTNLVQAIEQSNDVLRCIRLGYLGWTQPIHGQLTQFADRSFLLLDNNSAEPHVFAGHPRLETVWYERAVGPWPTDESPGDTEFAVTHRKAARIGVAWPLDMAMNASQQHANLFAHIGAVRSDE